MSKVHVKILKRAKKYIERRDEMFVCFAIRDAVDELYPNGSKDDTKADLLNFIEYYLGSHINVWYWLWIVHDIYASDEEMCEYRLLWIDQMIEYWKDTK